MVGTRWHATEHPVTTDVDIRSDDFWRRSFEERDASFAKLRREAPVSWHLPRHSAHVTPEVHGEAGFWAIVRNEDISLVGRDHGRFSSDLARWGSMNFQPADEAREANPPFAFMDPPQHTDYRGIVASSFSPKAVRGLATKIDKRAVQIVDRVVGMGDVDFVREVSAKLPMQTVADLVGVPENLVETFAAAGNAVVTADDPATVPEGLSASEHVLTQMHILREIGVDLVRHRRKHPTDDIATALAHAKPGGRALDDDDIEAFVVMLSVAGNDTTKQTTTAATMQLWQNPEQRAWLAEDYDTRIAPAVEEFIRHASPLQTLARTATEDIELRGQQIAQGDKVVLFFNSGNRDEEVFVDPHRFDLQRRPVGHVSFGGGGIHTCLGNGVAKAQLRALFRQILQRLPHMEIIGQPEPLFSDLINGTARLPVRV